MSVGQMRTFGGGRISADGGSITIDGDPSWIALGVTLVEGILFVNPEENNEQSPGITDERATKQFRSTHKGAGLTIRPGEDWFYVMTVSAPTAGTFPIGPVTIAYRAGGERRHVVTPTNMTLNVSRNG